MVNAASNGASNKVIVHQPIQGSPISQIQGGGAPSDTINTVNQNKEEMKEQDTIERKNNADKEVMNSNNNNQNQHLQEGHNHTTIQQNETSKMMMSNSW